MGESVAQPEFLPRGDFVYRFGNSASWGRIGGARYGLTVRTHWRAVDPQRRVRRRNEPPVRAGGSFRGGSIHAGFRVVQGRNVRGSKGRGDRSRIIRVQASGARF